MELAHRSNLKASLLSFNIDLQKLSDSYNQDIKYTSFGIIFSS